MKLVNLAKIIIAVGLIIALVLLYGCAQKPIEKVVYVPQEVKVPVLVPCTVDPVEKPKFALDDPAVKGKTPFEQGTAALAEIEERRAYELKLEEENKRCRKSP